MKSSLVLKYRISPQLQPQYLQDKRDVEIKCKTFIKEIFRQVGRWCCSQAFIRGFKVPMNSWKPTTKMEKVIKTASITRARWVVVVWFRNISHRYKTLAASNTWVHSKLTRRTFDFRRGRLCLSGGMDTESRKQSAIFLSSSQGIS